jgi:Rieske Fe-S protein
MPDDLTRRELVRRAALAGTLPVLARALAGCARRIEPARTVATAAPVEGVITAPLAALPELRREGGSVVLAPAGSAPTRFPFPALVVAARLGPPARYLAYKAECTHAGCLVTWVAEDQQIECPCHQSRFASDGRVVNPPANQQLRVLEARADDLGSLRVQLLPGDGTYPPLQDGAVTLAVADYPALQTDHGIVSGQPAAYPRPLIVVRLPGGTYRALSGTCPHLGCTVLQQAEGFLCPCHASQFTLSGSYLAGPERNVPLEQLPLSQPSPGVLRIGLPGTG